MLKTVITRRKVCYFWILVSKWCRNCIFLGGRGGGGGGGVVVFVSVVILINGIVMCGNVVCQLILDDMCLNPILL